MRYYLVLFLPPIKACRGLAPPRGASLRCKRHTKRSTSISGHKNGTHPLTTKTSRSHSTYHSNHTYTDTRQHVMTLENEREHPQPWNTPFTNSSAPSTFMFYLGGPRKDYLVNVGRGHQSRPSVPEAGNGKAEVGVVPAGLQHLAHDRRKVPFGFGRTIGDAAVGVGQQKGKKQK